MTTRTRALVGRIRGRRRQDAGLVPTSDADAEETEL